MLSRKPRARIGLAILLAALAAALAAGRPAQARPPAFEIATHVLKAPGRILDVAYADIDGDGKEDIVVAHLMGDGSTKDEHGVALRYVSVWKQGPKANPWSSAPDVTRNVPEDAVAFAVGDFHPDTGAEVLFLGARMVTLMRRGAGGAMLGQISPVTSVSSFFDYPAVGALPLWNLAEDISGSGRTDVLVPTKEGYLYLRNDKAAGLVPAGSIKVPSTERFGPAFETQFLNRFLTYTSTLPRLVAIDLNGDKRKDLVVYRKRGLARFLQKADGTFPESPDDEKPLGIVEDAAKKEKGKGGGGGGGAGGAGKAGGQSFTNVRLSLVDLDKDGYADLVATKTVGEVGVFETLRTQIMIWKGGEKGWDEAHPTRILNQKGVSADPTFIDWDGDGKLDLVVSSFRMDYFTNVKRAITSSITITYSIYLQQGEGFFPEEPDFTRDVVVDLEAVERRNGAEIATFDADMNGDHFRDMVLRSERGKIKIVPGAVESGFFSGKSITFKDDDAVEVEVPPNADIDSHDLYKDGKGDCLILSNPALDDPERSSLRVLEARR